MPRLPDPDATLDVLRRIGAAPTAPYHELAALAAIRAELERSGIATTTDRYGQLQARVSRGTAARALVFVAHTDHPAFEVTVANGREGRARVLGGFRGAQVAAPFAVRVHDDEGTDPFPARCDEPRPELDHEHNSPGTVRIRAEGPLRVGQWAVLDMPAVEVVGDEVRMAAADDLAGCALAVSALAALRDDDRPHDAYALFTRAEETGLYGARLVAEDGLIPREAYVVSIEASRALPHVPAGDGVVVRAGDYHNTFSNEAERYLRVAAERLAQAGIGTQRALLTGGTCEASSFVRLGWVATGMALPNVNYHNQSPDGTFAPEIVRLSDLRSGIALAVEAAVAAAEDASESWWPDVRTVPRAIRDLLDRGVLREGHSTKEGHS